VLRRRGALQGDAAYSNQQPGKLRYMITAELERVIADAY
jgi:hypothetical protein